MPDIARQWFIPTQGIERPVISADIQRYLGNDATVRPGQGSGEHQGVPGYWIKAYRNLTTAMIEDLKADSERWRQEQRQAAGRGSQSPALYDAGKTTPDRGAESYVGSVTHTNSSLGRPMRESPSVEPSYQGYGQGREIKPSASSSRMDIDQPMSSAGGRGQSGYAPENSRPYAGMERGYPVDSRPNPAGPGVPSRYYEQPGWNSGAAGTQSYVEPPRFPSGGYARGDDGAPPGYARQGNYYENAPVIPIRPDQFQGPPPGSYGQPPLGRDPRDGRFAPPSAMSDYPDSRYAYPSPATTVSSVTGRDREAVPKPSQASPYGTAPPPNQYDQYGGRPTSTSPGMSSVRAASSGGVPPYNAPASGNWYPRR